jgi:uncharacterized protein (DUF924 family)
MTAICTHTEVLDFWFGLEPKQWWVKDPAFDHDVGARFGATHAAACVGECFAWRDTPEGRLAEVIVLDQFSRNMFRDTSRAFAQDGLALVLAQEAVHVGADQALETGQRSFFYMPYMHSESMVIHAEAVRLFGAPGMGQNYEFELKHQTIIERFGRYPHRNAILGRTSTPEEFEFLKLPGSTF